MINKVLLSVFKGDNMSTITTLLLLLSFSAAYANCPAECDCCMSPYGNPQMQCPKQGNDLVIRLIKNTDLIIECSYLNYSRLEEIFPRFNRTKARNLKISYCPITSDLLSYILTRMETKLDQVYFQDITASNFSALFRNIKSLKTLHLRSVEAVVEENIFGNIHNLQHLIIEKQTGMSLKNMFQKATKLRVLGLIDNSISTLDDDLFIHLKQLRMLSLSDNNLKILSKNTFTGLSNLKNIDLAQNNINSIQHSTFSSMPNLRHINLGDNNLTYIDFSLFSYNSNLRTLVLSGNNIVRLTEKPPRTLELLNLKNNKLRSISFVAPDLFSNIKHLDLSFNSICVIPEDILVGKANLKTLNLGYNQLQELHIDKIFNGISSNVTINLKNNQIAIVKGFSKMNSSIFRPKLVLSGNPLNCNSSNCELFRYVSEKNEEIYIEIENVSCNGREDYRHEILEDVIKKLNCYPV